MAIVASLFMCFLIFLVTARRISLSLIFLKQFPGYISTSKHNRACFNVFGKNRGNPLYKQQSQNKMSYIGLKRKRGVFGFEKVFFLFTFLNGFFFDRNEPF